MASASVEYDNAVRATDAFIVALTKWALAGDGQHRADCSKAWRDWIGAINRHEPFVKWFVALEQDRNREVWSITGSKSKLGGAVVEMQRQLADLKDKATSNQSPGWQKYFESILEHLSSAGWGTSGRFVGFNTRLQLDQLEEDLDKVLRKGTCRRSEKHNFNPDTDGDPDAIEDWEMEWPPELRACFQHTRSALDDVLMALLCAPLSRDLEVTPILFVKTPEARDTLLRTSEFGTRTELIGLPALWHSRLVQFREWLGASHKAFGDGGTYEVLSKELKGIKESLKEAIGSPDPDDVSPKPNASGFLGGEELANALNIHPTRRAAFEKQLERRRKKLGDEFWEEVANPLPNRPRYKYRADSPMLQHLAVGYTRPKPT